MISVREASASTPADPAKTPVEEARQRHREALAAGRARRAASNASPAATAAPSAPHGRRVHDEPQTPTGERLGTDARTTVPQLSGLATGREARDHAHRLRAGLQPVSERDRFKECGRKLVAGAAALTVGKTKAGAAAAGYRGVSTCGSVHTCPVCQSGIRAVRADELHAGGEAWEEAGHGLALVTLTMRHYARQALDGLVQIQRRAWRRALGQNALRTTKAALRALGYRGYVRAWETTHGDANGWHAHYHVVYFFDRPLTPDQGAKLEELISGVWADAVVTEGGYRPDRDHGVQVDVPGRGEFGATARYLMKDQIKRWGVAQEVTQGNLKVGSPGHRMPLEIGQSAAAGNERDGQLWREFEAAAHGIRSLYWSQGLRALLADLVELDERKDQELAADEAAGAADAAPVALFPPGTWYRHVLRSPGRRLELMHAAERWGQAGARALVESWGLIWGVDVLEPEVLPAGAALTLAELLARRDRAELAARAEVWRREFDRQDRDDRLGRAEYQPGVWQARADAHRAVVADRTNVGFLDHIRAARAARRATSTPA